MLATAPRTVKRARLKEQPHNEFSEVRRGLVPAQVVSLEAVTHGRLVDTVEVSTNWSKLAQLHQ
jgi:hypothetical protein